MSIVDSFMKQVRRGKEGKNKGIPTGLNDLDKYLYGVQRKTMTTIGADSGSGKTTFSLFTYVYKPLQYSLSHPEIPVDILIFSLEMSQESLLAKLLSLYILDTFHEYISYKEIFSLDGEISDHKLDLILKSRAWLDQVDDKLTIYDKSCNAAAVAMVTRNWASHFGTFTETDNSEKFEPNNPNQYLITVVDHMRLLVGADKRLEINNCADAFVKLRDLCKLTVVLIQQLNRNFKSMERRDSAYNLIEMSDFADASGPTQGSEFVIALYHPHRERKSTCEKYDIKKLRDAARIVQILKSRHGTSDVVKGVLFKGEIGYYKELPNPEEYELDYDKILAPEYLYTDVKFGGKKQEKKKMLQLSDVKL